MPDQTTPITDDDRLAHEWASDASPSWGPRALDAAGHLLPDLPEPDETVMPGDCIGWDVGEDLLVQYAPRTNTVALEGFYGHGIRITPDEARDTAYALLAAADWAEKHDHDQ